MSMVKKKFATVLDSLRTCSKCKEEKFTSEFYWIKSRNSYGWYCKPCNNKRPKGSKYYEKHLETVLRCTKERTKRQKEKAILLLGGCCTDCKRTWDCVAVYDFHHLDGTKKAYTVGDLFGSATWSIIEKELEKCILLCAVRHRIRHYN